MLLMLLLFSVLERRRRSERGERQGGGASALQDFQGAQGPEGSLLDAADVVFVQLTAEKQRSEAAVPAESSLLPLPNHKQLRRRET